MEHCGRGIHPNLNGLLNRNTGSKVAEPNIAADGLILDAGFSVKFTGWL